jgi:hypothetical protein
LILHQCASEFIGAKEGVRRTFRKFLAPRVAGIKNRGLLPGRTGTATEYG